ncbi:uncharacterized protein LOC143244296 [Tachypleus tridentatus]|uniref:uncharacterized protein LOC143244296 n=1 Tax=Tachypleus tridentatus TaxID=6853 RepID=UPI003FD20051
MSSGYEDSGSPRVRRRKIQNLLSSLTQTKTTLPRSGSVHNLVPPTEQHAPLSKSLPPSPQRSPAQSRKCSLQDSSVILWNTYDPEEDDLDRLLEQVLILPHDEGILSLAKERGKTLYSNLSLENRKIKLNKMISKLQTAIDGESERRFQLDKEETRASNTSEKTRLAFLIAKSDEKMQALSVLMLHFLSGLQHCQEQEHQKSPALVSTDVVSEHTIKETKDSLPRQKATNICEQAENIPVVNILSTEEDVVNDTFHPLDNNEYATELLESSVPQLMLSNDHCNQIPSPVIRGDQNINIQGQFFPDTDALVEQLMIIDEQNIDLQDQHSEESSSLGSHVVTSYDWNINFPEHVSLLTNLSLKQVTANKEKYNGDQSQFLPESNSSDLSTVASEDQRSNLVLQNQSQAEHFTVGDDSYHELHGQVSLPHITSATSDQGADGENEKPICEPKLPTASSSSHSSPLI